MILRQTGSDGLRLGLRPVSPACVAPRREAVICAVVVYSKDSVLRGNSVLRSKSGFTLLQS